MWCNRIASVMDEVVPFNHELLQNYHDRKIKDIPIVLENLFKQFVRIINNTNTEDSSVVKYHGCVELSPKERVLLLKDPKQFERSYNIRKTNKRVFKFTFEYEEKLHHITVDVPYLNNGNILLEGTEYYPQFYIMDRGGMTRSVERQGATSRKPDQVALQVMRVILKFNREKQVSIKTLNNTAYVEHPITAHIHHGSKGHKKNTPIILLNLANEGLQNTIIRYGLKNLISITDKLDLNDNYEYIGIPNGLFIKVDRKTLLGELQNPITTKLKRFIINLKDIYEFYTDYDITRIYDIGYYIIALGAWIHPSPNSNTGGVASQHLYKHAAEFLEMNKTIIDPIWHEKHRSIGIEYESIDDLMKFMFDHIDELILDYKNNNNNLLMKQLAGADSFLTKIINVFNKRTFSILNAKSKQRPLNIGVAMRHISFTKTVRDNEVFYSAPMFYSDNLLAVLGKRYIAFGGPNKKRSSKNRPPEDLLVVHYSYPYVCSPFTFPSSNPIVTGSINPYLQIDMKHGNIKEPWFIDELKEIYN